METKKRALGRGLEQLFNTDNLDMNNMSQFEREVYSEIKNEEIIEINLSDLRANPYQPRTIFKDEALMELANSIKEHGVFQPIIVKKSDIKGYEIIAGERRFRASKLAGLLSIPAIVRNFTDDKMMEIALLENLQRENLSSIEEAKAYQSMLEKMNITQDLLSKKVGKSRSHVTNILGLLRLPEKVQNYVSDGLISMGHARSLSKLDGENKINELTDLVLKENLSVRQLEEIILKNNTFADKKNIANRRTEIKEYDYVSDLLVDKFDTKVKIKNNKIVISFTNNADLNRILEILNIKE